MVAKFFLFLDEDRKWYLFRHEGLDLDKDVAYDSSGLTHVTPYKMADKVSGWVLNLWKKYKQQQQQQANAAFNGNIFIYCKRHAYTRILDYDYNYVLFLSTSTSFVYCILFLSRMNADSTVNIQL